MKYYSLKTKFEYFILYWVPYFFPLAIIIGLYLIFESTYKITHMSSTVLFAIGLLLPLFAAFVHMKIAAKKGLPLGIYINNDAKKIAINYLTETGKEAVILYDLDKIKLVECVIEPTINILFAEFGEDRYTHPNPFQTLSFSVKISFADKPDIEIKKISMFSRKSFLLLSMALEGLIPSNVSTDSKKPPLFQLIVGIDLKESENFLRENISSFEKTGKFKFTVEHPVLSVLIIIATAVIIVLALFLYALSFRL